MINKFVSSKIIVERIYSNYNIQSDDFVTKLSTWIYSCLRELGIKQVYKLENILIDFNNGRCAIPSYVDKVYGVKINGILATLDFSDINKDKISNIGAYNHSVIDFGEEFIADRYIVEEGSTIEAAIPNTIVEYKDSNGDLIMTGTSENIRTWIDPDVNYIYKICNGWLQTNINKGFCELLAGCLPYEYEETLDCIFPIIPDDEYLIESISQYCLRNILMRGYKHPILSLQSNNEFINPAMAYTRSKISARNSCNAMTPAAKEALKLLIGNSII